MLEFLQTNSALPSLHPAIIHFPIALVFVALFFRVIHFLKPDLRRWSEGADVLGYLAALGAIAAFLSGRQAADSVGGLSASAEVALVRHADMAEWAMVVLVLAALISMALKRIPFSGWLANPRFNIFLKLVVFSVAAVVVTVTADYGGALVYEFGVGATTAVPTKIVETNESVAGEVGSQRKFPNGQQIWDYKSGEILELVVDGSGLISLPGEWGDGVVEVMVDPGDFTGEIALVHRYSSPSSWEGFRFSTDGTLDLLRLGPSGEESRDNSAMLFPKEKFTMRSSAVSGHFKGLVDNEVLVHGHGDSGERGRSGLLVSGKGKLTVLSIKVTEAGE